jgi:methyltransferase (TIGR00027 family)
MGRAIGSREPDERVRNPDYLAGELIGPEERALFGDHPLVAAMDKPYEEASQEWEVLMAARLMIPRTRFIDSRLQEAIKDGARQLVILGAGFDTRAYRLKEVLSNARVFEVDHPMTQERKKLRVLQVIAEPPQNLTYIPVDFRNEAFGERLLAAGYRRDQLSFFIWEGVTMYLPADTVHATLKWVCENSPAGSRIVFDYTYEIAIRMIAAADSAPLPPQAKQAIERMRRMTAGEPWIFGVPDRKEEEFMHDLGFRLRKVLGMSSKEAVESYLTRADGSILGKIPGTDPQGYLILEAEVA